MRVVAPCAVCAEEQKPKHPNELNFVVGELTESGVVYLDCDKGHKSAVIYDARRYQVLLRSGGKALLSGHSNESIASFAAALERAYEFYIRVACRVIGISRNEFEKTWKSVESQSERQLGAFNFLFLVQEKSAIDLDPKIPQIRNKIVHKGQIATEKDAREFGELIFKRVRVIEKALAPHTVAVSEEAENELQMQEKTIPKEMKFGRLTIFSKMVYEGKVIGDVERFSDFLDGLQQSTSKGMS